MSTLKLKDPNCEIARFILATYWYGVGHEVQWCDVGADGAGFELPVEKIYPLAGRIVDDLVRLQRIDFMVAVGWLPSETFKLGGDSGSVRFSIECDFGSRKAPPWLLPDGVLPLDKIAVVLAASVVETGQDKFDLLVAEVASDDWETFELYNLQVLLDSDRDAPSDGVDLDALSLLASLTLHAKRVSGPPKIDLAERAAEQALVPDMKSQRWWSRK